MIMQLQCQQNFKRMDSSFCGIFLTLIVPVLPKVKWIELQRHLIRLP